MLLFLATAFFNPKKLITTDFTDNFLLCDDTKISILFVIAQWKVSSP